MTDIVGGLTAGPDKAKLVGIETAADVTDVTNVAAAGAVMDTDIPNQSFLNLIKNGDFSSWSNGVTPPDGWDGGTRESTIVKSGAYSNSVTRSGSNTHAVQAIDVTRVNYYKSRTYTLGAWVYAAVANSVGIGINDGVNTTLEYHSGGSTWEWLSVTKTMAAGATALSIRTAVYNNDDTGYFDGVILVQGSLVPAFEVKPLEDDGKTLIIDSANNKVTVCSLEVGCGIVFNRTTLNAATYTTEITDSIIGVTYTATGAVTITISSAHIAIPGKYIRVVDEGGNANTHNITINTEGAETISGAATQVISTDYGRLRIYSDGTNCFLS